MVAAEGEAAEVWVMRNLGGVASLAELVDGACEAGVDYLVVVSLWAWNLNLRQHHAGWPGIFEALP